MPEIDQYAFGRMEAKVENFEKRMDFQDTQLGNINSKLDMLTDHMNQSKGGLRLIFTLSSISAAFGAGIVYVIKSIKGG